MRYFKVAVVPLLILASIYILVYQPQILEITIGESSELPIGTLISWLLVFLIPLFLYLNLGFDQKSIFERVLKWILKLNVFVGLAWGVISSQIAGNWNFVFSEDSRMLIWLSFTTIVLIIPFLVFIIWSILKLKRFFKKV